MEEGDLHMPAPRTWIAAIVVLAVAGGLLGFTGSGHRVLHTLGVAAACSTDDCGGN